MEKTRGKWFNGSWERESTEHRVECWGSLCSSMASVWAASLDQLKLGSVRDYNHGTNEGERRRKRQRKQQQTSTFWVDVQKGLAVLAHSINTTNPLLTWHHLLLPPWHQWKHCLKQKRWRHLDWRWHLDWSPAQSRCSHLDCSPAQSWCSHHDCSPTHWCCWMRVGVVKTPCICWSLLE